MLITFFESATRFITHSDIKAVLGNVFIADNGLLERLGPIGDPCEVLALFYEKLWFHRF